MGEQHETLCWKCQNFLKCSWSDGKPVAGWSATPTVIRHGNGCVAKSYCVHKCPCFKADEMPKKPQEFEVKWRELAEFAGYHIRTVARLLKTEKGRDKIKQRLAQNNFAVKFYNNGKGQHNIYLSDLAPAKKHNFANSMTLKDTFFKKVCYNSGATRQVSGL